MIIEAPRVDDVNSLGGREKVKSGKGNSFKQKQSDKHRKICFVNRFTCCSLIHVMFMSFHFIHSFLRLHLFAFREMSVSHCQWQQNTTDGPRRTDYTWSFLPMASGIFETPCDISSATSETREHCLVDCLLFFPAQTSSCACVLCLWVLALDIGQLKKSNGHCGAHTV